MFCPLMLLAGLGFCDERTTVGERAAWLELNGDGTGVSVAERALFEVHREIFFVDSATAGGPFHGSDVSDPAGLLQRLLVAAGWGMSAQMG